MIKVLVLSLLYLCSVSARGAHSAVQYDALTKLYFFADDMTTGRRNAPVLQLEQFDSDEQLFARATCTRSSASSPWQCTAEPKPGFAAQVAESSFDRLDVQCEGFDWPDDPDVLVGSCALRYSLVQEPAEIGACCMPDVEAYTTTTTVEETVETTTHSSHIATSDWLEVLIVLLVALAFFRCMCEGRSRGPVHNVHPPASPPSYEQATRPATVHYVDAPHMEVHHHHRAEPACVYTSSGHTSATRSAQPSTTTTTRRTTTTTQSSSPRRAPTKTTNSNRRPQVSRSVSGTASSSRR